jgi:SNF2 family DNA or RNA helicase
MANMDLFDAPVPQAKDVCLKGDHHFLSHQVTGVDWMIARELDLKVRGGILADEPGMGKTIMTIGLMLALPKKCTLIVAPKSVVHQWYMEIKKFSDLSVAMVDRQTEPMSKADLPSVVVVSYGLLRPKRETAKKPGTFLAAARDPAYHWIMDVPWSRIVLDEAHMMKNPKTQVAKGAMRLRINAVKFALTGTPIQNSRTDLMTLAGWMGYFESSAARDVCKRLVLRRTIEDVPDFVLPPLHVRVESIEFNDMERAMYEAVEQYARKRVANALKSTRNNMEILEAILRCRQICSHPQMFIDGMRKKMTVEYEDDFREELLEDDWTEPVSKMDRTVRVIQDMPEGEKAVIMCSFIQEMTTYAAAIQDSMPGVRCAMFHGGLNDDKRVQVLEDFRTAPETRVLLVQILAGGTGLNLQGANHVIILSPQWNPMWEVQALGRCYRHGQTRPVTLTRMVVRQTIEERICEIQSDKLAMVSAALDDPRIGQKLALADLGLTAKDVKKLFRK